MSRFSVICCCVNFGDRDRRHLYGVSGKQALRPNRSEMSTARVIDNSEVGRQMASDAAKDEEKRQRKTAKTITREGGRVGRG